MFVETERYENEPRRGEMFIESERSVHASSVGAKCSGRSRSDSSTDPAHSTPTGFGICSLRSYKHFTHTGLVILSLRSHKHFTPTGFVIRSLRSYKHFAPTGFVIRSLRSYKHSTPSGVERSPSRTTLFQLVAYPKRSPHNRSSNTLSSRSARTTSTRAE